MNYSPAYVLMGDIAVLADDGGAAAKNYDQAIFFDRKNVEAYRKYAIIYSKISFESSIDKLEQLRSEVPNYPVDLPIARLYDNAGKIDDAIRFYERVGLDQMEARDLAMFALKYNLIKDYAKSLAVLESGLKRFPRSSSLNRLGLMNAIAQQDFDNALIYGDRLFNKSDSVELKDMDFVNFAKAYIGKQNYDEAIALYRKGIEVSQADKDAVNNLFKEISDAYMKKGDFDNAVVEYRKYLDGTSNKTASDYSTLAEMYYKHAADLTGEEQMANIKMCDDIYKELQERFANNPDVVAYVLNRRGTLNAIMDPDSKQGLAKPIFEQLMQMLEAKTERTDTDTKRLITCYRYMLSYDLLVQDNKEAAKAWAEKILTLDPENEQAKAVMEL
jgi:tetratricopeptide (TPR) repeat protein